MRYEIEFSPQAVDDLRGIDAIPMKQATFEQVTTDLEKYLQMAESEEIVIMRQGQPAGVLIGFASDDDWFDFGLENDPRLLKRVAEARRSLAEGRGTRLEDLPEDAR